MGDGESERRLCTRLVGGELEADLRRRTLGSLAARAGARMDLDRFRLRLAESEKLWTGLRGLPLRAGSGVWAASSATRTLVTVFTAERKNPDRPRTSKDSGIMNGVVIADGS